MIPAELVNKWKEEGKTHVVFDFDETIATLLVDWPLWQRKMLALLRLFDPSYDPERDFVKADHINSFIRRFGDEARTPIVELNREMETEHCSGLEKNEACLSLVHALYEAGFSLVVWSSNDSSTLAKHLFDLGILELFSPIVGRDDVTSIKPDPDGWRLVNPEKLPVERFVFVGDSKSDSGACAALGLDFVHVSEVTRV